MKGKKKRDLKIYMTVAAVVALTVAATVWGSVILNKESGSKNSHPASNPVFQYHIAMISHNPSDIFWQSVYQGAEQEGIKVNSYVENFGADLSETYTVEELFRMAIAAKTDGIIVETDGSDGWVALIDEAEEEGIPVVTVQQDAPDSKRKSFVSANDYALGEMYGNQVAAAVKSNVKDQCKVSVLVNTDDVNESPNLIYSGIREVLAGTAQNVSISPVIVDGNGNFESEETIRSVVLNQSERPDILVCLSAADTISAYQSVIDYNMVGKIRIIGYYFSPEILEGIQKGIICSSVAINAREMGTVSVRGIYEYITEKYVSEYLPVTSELITQENAKQYTEKEKE